MDLFEIRPFLKTMEMATSEPMSPIMSRTPAKHNGTARLVPLVPEYHVRVVLRVGLNSGTRRSGEIFGEAKDFSSARANEGSQAPE
jgi:hypothetical protein